MKFASLDASQAARKALDGRWFASKQLQADFMSERLYLEKFPGSRVVLDNDNEDDGEE